MAHYKNCDIIMCFPGIGRTFFAEGESSYVEKSYDAPKHCKRPFFEETRSLPRSSFTLDKDFTGNDPKGFIDEIVSIQQSKQFRYILIPMRYDLAKQLNERVILFIVVKPYEQDRDAWMKRWMKAGETAIDLEARRVEMNNSESGYSAFAPIVHLNADEWLGNILDQSPIRVGEAE